MDASATTLGVVVIGRRIQLLCTRPPRAQKMVPVFIGPYRHRSWLDPPTPRHPSGTMRWLKGGADARIISLIKPHYETWPVTRKARS